MSVVKSVHVLRIRLQYTISLQTVLPKCPEPFKAYLDSLNFNILNCVLLFCIVFAYLFRTSFSCSMKVLLS